MAVAPDIYLIKLHLADWLVIWHRRALPPQVRGGHL